MRVLARTAGALLLLAACTSSVSPPGATTDRPATSPAGHTSPSGTTGGTTPAVTPSGSAGGFVLPPPTTGDESAAAVRARLCVRPPAPAASPAPTTGTVPPAVAQAEQEVADVRGLSFDHPVAVDAATHARLVHGLDASFDHSFPEEMLARRSEAWSTIGVIPPGTSLRDAYRAFLSSQVIGYYDPSTGQLVFIGTENPSPYERFTLAHELTHADDDQHFDLARLNDLENACDDERLLAATGAVEGSAVYFSLQVVRQFFSTADQARLAIESGGGSAPQGVPPFVEHLEEWPYLDGPTFVTDVRSFGGLDEVNSALRNFPVSTEQVMHPEKFPDDTPVEVSVSDLGPDLGAGWRDLDVMDTGEEWIKEALALHLDRSLAAQGADGWGGAQYRAWTDGTHVAVLWQTEWDTPKDAAEFLDAVRSWLGGRDTAAVAPVAGDDRGVVALFASDAATLSRLEGALG